MVQALYRRARREGVSVTAILVTTEEQRDGVRIRASFRLNGSPCFLERVVPEHEVKAVTVEMVEACEAMRSRDE